METCRIVRATLLAIILVAVVELGGRRLPPVA